MKFQVLVMAGLASVVGASAIHASTATLNATASGFYHQAGSFTNSGNYAVGLFQGVPPGELRDYFVFDLSGVVGPITAATLRAFNPSTGFSSPDPSETWTLFDVSTAIATLTAGTGGVSAFTDLGTGTVYGSVAVTNASNNNNVDVTLNAAALTFLNSSSGLVAIGGAITTFNPSDTTDQRLFNNSSGTGTRQLILTTDIAAVPEPGTLGLFAGAAAFLFFLRKRTCL